MKRLRSKFGALLVIVPDRLSALVEKGELIDRYYNPGDLFGEVHILLTNSDKADKRALQKAVGSAQLHLHNLPRPNFIRSFGYQTWLINVWMKEGMEIARRISPKLIRVHNNFIEGYLAAKIKEELNVPFVISLHGVWDRDLDLFRSSPEKWLFGIFTRKFQKYSVQKSDHVIAVYKPILRYARSLGAKKVSLIYNVVAKDIPSKKNYKLHLPPRLITINRQLREKNPENIIRAIKDIYCRYLLIGDGAYHNHLMQIALEEGVAEKISFIKAMPNEEIRLLLREQDLMVSHVDYWGMSKTVIEASLAGLPTIINRHPIEPIPEFSGDWAVLVDNTTESYRNAIVKLLKDQKLRQHYGEKARQHSKKTFDPVVMENKTVSIYKSLVG